MCSLQVPYFRTKGSLEKTDRENWTRNCLPRDPLVVRSLVYLPWKLTQARTYIWFFYAIRINWWKWFNKKGFFLPVEVIQYCYKKHTRIKRTSNMVLDNCTSRNDRSCVYRLRLSCKLNDRSIDQAYYDLSALILLILWKTNRCSACVCVSVPV